jgi:signal transduction histidine kinase
MIQRERHDLRLSIASVPATPLHLKVARGFSIGIALAFAGLAPIGLMPLPRSDSVLPALQAIIAAADLITAVLLFAQYAAERLRALLLLAGGYLFTAAIVIVQALTFPGAFAPTGLLGAGVQTAAALYVVWHVAFPAVVIGYALLKGQQLATGGIHATPAVAIRRTVIATLAASCLVAWASIAAHDWLPQFIATERSFATSANYALAFAMLVSVTAFVVLWRRRTSVLDVWLTVALSAAIAETAFVVFVAPSRYSVAFYAGRAFAVITSSAVLVAMLSEWTKLYIRLSGTVKTLQRERANKLMNLDVVVGSIAHELKQPLTVVTTSRTTIERLVRKPNIDVEKLQLNVEDMASASVRIGETIDGLRGWFRNSQEVQREIDVNQLVLESLDTLAAELSDRRISVSTELATSLPPVIGHWGQLREVVVNIVQNAIDAMALSDRSRTLRIGTGRPRQDRISITIEDSGPGIEPVRLPNLFSAFVSTKAGGMGLGLGICQMIVHRHNGELSVSSELGKGARFEVVLPVEQGVSSETPLLSPGSIEARLEIDALRSRAR